MPVSELQRLKPVETPKRTICSDLLLRAAAILMIVVHHATLWPIPGGAAVLMMLVGYGLARFQSAALFAGATTRLMRSLAVNLAIYAPIVIGFCLVRGEVLWPSVLLIGNLALTGPEKMLPYLYWFVEAYAQVLLLVAALFSSQAVRRIVRAQPFASGIAALAVAVGIKFAAPQVWNIGNLSIFTAPDVFYLAVLGWCIHFARTARQRLGLMALALVMLPILAYWGGNWTGSWMKFGLLMSSVAVLLYAPRVGVPAWLARLALPISAASYHIYLFHRLLPEIFLPQPDVTLSNPIAAGVAIVSGVLVGMVVHSAQKRLTGWLAEQRSQGRDVLAPAE